MVWQLCSLTSSSHTLSSPHSLLSSRQKYCSTLRPCDSDINIFDALARLLKLLIVSFFFGLLPPTITAECPCITICFWRPIEQKGPTLLFCYRSLQLTLCLCIPVWVFTKPSNMGSSAVLKLEIIQMIPGLVPVSIFQIAGQWSTLCKYRLNKHSHWCNGFPAPWKSHLGMSYHTFQIS